MHLVNILRIFAFSLVLGHSNFNNTYFNGFSVFFGHPDTVVSDSVEFQFKSFLFIPKCQKCCQNCPSQIHVC